MPPRVVHHENRRQRFPRPRPGAAPLDDAVVTRVITTSPHRPILLREVLRVLQPRPGDRVIDATLGGAGHAEALLAHIQPGGRLLGLDVDPVTLPATEARLRAAGYDADAFRARHGNFADLPELMTASDLDAADLVLVDLGVSSLQHDAPTRGFDVRSPGPLDLRLDQTRGEPAHALLARLDAEALASLLERHADEPHARLIGHLLARAPVTTTHALERTVRLGLNAAQPELSRGAVKLSVRRTLQALRIEVNDELTALDRLLAALPACLAPGGRVAILTFHSGEDRRVKQAFRTGQRAGIYASAAGAVLRSTIEETRANRRAMAAKLRWAVRARCAAS